MISPSLERLRQSRRDHPKGFRLSLCKRCTADGLRPCLRLTKRSSPWSSLSSSQSRAKGSLNAARAASNETPWRSTFATAFAASHSNVPSLIHLRLSRRDVKDQAPPRKGRSAVDPPARGRSRSDHVRHHVAHGAQRACGGPLIRPRYARPPSPARGEGAVTPAPAAAFGGRTASGPGRPARCGRPAPIPPCG